MRYIEYFLKIEINEDDYEKSRKKINEINKLLGIKSNQNIYDWSFIKIELPNSKPVFFIEKVYDILNGKMEILENKFGIRNTDITIIMSIFYRGQCGFEFHGKETKLLSELGVKLKMNVIELES